MEYSTDKRGNALIVRLEGRLEAAEVPVASARFEEYATAPEPVVVLNLQGITFVDSSGLGLLVSLLRKRRERDADVTLCSPSPQAHTLLELTRFNRVFTIHDDEASAVAAAG